MNIAALATLINRIGAGSAIAANTDAGTGGRPGAVLSEASCVAVWHRLLPVKSILGFTEATRASSP